MIRLALVGFGKWGKNYISAAESTGLAKVTTLVIRPNSSKWLDLDTTSFKCTSDIDELDIDAAIVAIHPGENVSVCCKLLNNKIPVLVEKPLALSIEDAIKIENCAINANVQFMVNHQHLYSNAYQEILKIIKNEEILAINTKAGNLGPYRDYSSIWDYGPHDIAMIFGINKNPLELNIIKQKVNNKLGSSYYFEFIKNNKFYSSTEIWNDTLPKKRLLEIKLKNKSIVYDDTLIINKLSVNGMPVPLLETLPLTNTLSFFLSAIKNNVELSSQDNYVFTDNVGIIKTISMIENKKLLTNPYLV
jgi:predicted dehydrogenase